MFTRSKRNIFFGFGVFIVLTTIILIASIQNDIRFSSEYLKRSTKFDLTTKFKANNAKCTKDEVEINLLQRPFCPAKDLFHDLRDAIEYVESKDSRQTESGSNETVTIADLFTINAKEKLTTLDKFNLAIRKYELYSENSTLVDELLRDMATRKIIRVEEKSGGTQFKLKIEFDNGMYAIAKPMRFPREQYAFSNQLQFAEFERHTAEIAAYHLDRILGFRRTMPVIGRVLNVTSEIYEIASRNLTNTFYTSPPPDNARCFYGTCRQYCTINHSFCAKGDFIEAALISYFPTYFNVKVDETQSPWRKSYDKKRKTIWERDPKYCEKVKYWDEYRFGKRRFLDLMDQILFDFFTGNKDRHHYACFRNFGEDTFILNFDNGRAFGRPYYDEELNLMPLQQCCVIRASTLKTLLRFHNGPKTLAQLMRESMASDPINDIAPILTEPHLEALDRRVGIILNTFRDCIKNKPIEDVIFAREFFTPTPNDY